MDDDALGDDEAVLAARSDGALTRLGVDVGSTTTRAALHRDGDTVVLRLGGPPPGSDPSGAGSGDEPPDGMPSVVVLGAEGRPVAGRAPVGGVVGSGVRPDQGPPAVDDVVLRLGDPSPIDLGGGRFPATELLAALLTPVRAAAAGSAPDVTTVVVPAVWGAHRREEAREAAESAGLPGVGVVSSAEAVAAQVARESGLPDGALVGVYDLGGRSFTWAVVRVAADECRLVGEPDGVERLGGDDLDTELLRHVDAALLGALTEQAHRDAAGSARLAEARRACRTARELLSTESSVTVRVPLVDGERSVLVTRADFEAAAAPLVETTVETVTRALESADLGPADLSALVLVGGASQTPLVRTRLADLVPGRLRAPAWPQARGALAAAEWGAPLPPTSSPAGPSPATARAGRGRWPATRRTTVILATAAVTVAAALASVGLPTLGGGSVGAGGPVPGDAGTVSAAAPASTAPGTETATVGPPPDGQPGEQPGEDTDAGGDAPGGLTASRPQPQVVSTVGMLGGRPEDVEVAASDGVAYVADSATSGVAEVDLASGEVMRLVPVADEMRGLALAADGGELFVTVAGERPGVVVVDTASMAVTGRLVGFERPGRPAVTPDGATLVVPDEDRDRVYAVDLVDGVASPLADVAAPSEVVLSPDVRRAYVSSSRSGFVDVVDVESGSTVGQAAVGQGPVSLAVSRDGARVYAAAARRDELVVLGADGRTLETVRVGRGPVDVAVAADDRHVYVVNGEDATVSVVETGTASVTGEVAVGGEPRGVGVGSSGELGAVTSAGDDSVSVLSLTEPPALVTSAPTADPGERRGLLYNYGNGCLDLPAEGAADPGTPAQKHNTCVFGRSDNQVFVLADHWSGGEEGSGTYLGVTVENVASGLCLDVPGEDQVPAGEQVILFSCDSSEADNQLFRVEQRTESPSGQALSFLVHRKTGLCLDVDGERDTGNDLSITLWPCSELDDHLWAVL